MNTLSSDLTKTIKALKAKRYEVTQVKTASEALENIKKIIPKGVSVMNGSSVTLEQIGFIDYLASGKHKWEDLHAKITAEDDKEKRDELRKRSILSDFYLGSVHALLENGEFLIASNSGSQLPHIVYTSENLIFVVSTKKIVPTFEAAMKRVLKLALPLEKKRMKKLYNKETNANRILIFRGEKKETTRKIHFILVDEDLGF